MSNSALDDIEQTANQPKAKSPFWDIILNFLAKALFSYLPLSVYCIVNIPYFKDIGQSEQTFLQGMFLALSYVFISQVNSLSFKQDALGNFLYSVKIFSGICCIVLFATDKFNLNLCIFFAFFAVSLTTLFFSSRITSVDMKKISDERSI
ncbi:hypothetical protein [Campylobacter sp. CCUG 57310]|uniref:hypothetical protein n=1 Tax=Campylobacter sp. CCUG 57310 TaxID=2517362 RepID=UPI001567BECA|nr:hypothetical protein [Campylobacter sp. CCUG 57310]QKF91488.1 hypothetical protein CORI_0255 [Campylobacter sp. CCUG 57310]